jgi:hypothetical protein
MKRCCTLAIFLALAASTHATEYLLYEPAAWKLATRFDILAAEIAGEEALLAGVGAGARISDNLYALLHGAMAFESVATAGGQVDGGDCWHLGGRLEWIVRRAERYNLGVHLLMAVQRMSVEWRETRESDSAFLLQPGVDASLNLWAGAELGATLGFRWLDDMAAGGYDEHDFDGLTGGVFMRFTQAGP